MTDRAAAILAALADKPGAIAPEIGATAVEMIRLEEEGSVERVGKRKTGKRGRPPVEWAVSGAVAQEDVNDFPIGMPRLPDIEHLRPFLGEEEERQVGYIERMFQGIVLREDKFGSPHEIEVIRELGDYRLLKERYVQIAKSVERRIGSRAVDLHEDE